MLLDQRDYEILFEPPVENFENYESCYLCVLYPPMDYPTPVAVEFNFVLDASYPDSCEEPYRIDFNQSFTQAGGSCTLVLMADVFHHKFCRRAVTGT